MDYTYLLQGMRKKEIIVKTKLQILKTEKPEYKCSNFQIYFDSIVEAI